MKCSICDREIKKEHGVYGNNAMPVNEGRCCKMCNTTVVIPARLNRLWVQTRFRRDNQ